MSIKKFILNEKPNDKGLVFYLILNMVADPPNEQGTYTMESGTK